MLDLDLTDCHVHFYRREHAEQILADLQRTGARQFNILVTARDQADPLGEQLDNAIWLKQQMPDQVFLFGGFDFRGMFDRGQPQPDIPFETQLQHLIDLGCDGLKLLIGKPDRRKAISHPLDGPLFEPMLALAEQAQFPLLWHVGDPPEFWDEKTTPLWARRRGWWYDQTHPTKAQIDAEIAKVFRRHPKLRLILPHFFFLSDRLDDAAKLLDEHPTYSFDLAPGVEMLHNFTANRDAARAFFIRYADRILFGSDFGLTCGWSPDRGNMIRRFLETEDVFDVPDDPAMTPDDRPPLHGIALPQDVLKLIYTENFRGYVGDRPKPLNLSAHKAWMAPVL